MTTPASGTITMDDLRTEFGFGSSSISLGLLYRGGGIVPNTAAFTSVPTSGAISLDDFYGLTYVQKCVLTPSSEAINLVYPTLNGTSGNMTVSNASTAHTISFSHTAGGTVTWRKNGGSYTTGTLSVVNGDYINFRYQVGFDDSGTATILDDTAYSLEIGQCAVSKTGSP